MTTEAALRIALVEDDADMRASTAQILSLAGYAVDSFALATHALATIEADYPGVVVSDVRMPHMSGTELLAILQARDATLPVLLLTGHGDVAMAVAALQAGAWDFLTKPFDPDALLAAVARAGTARSLALENRRLKALAGADDMPALIGDSPAIRRLREMIPALADAAIDLYIEGETGTGKEMLARLIHRAGRRARHRFRRVACAGYPDALLDTDLFARAGDGSVVSAHRGTLFLDDVDQASRPLQLRLKALIEERAILGRRPEDAVPIDLRVIATGSDADRLAVGTMDPALFYRLAGLRLRVPPVRERREDIPLLFAHFAGEEVARLGRDLPPLSEGQRRYLREHNWPGNVREIAHYAVRIVHGVEEIADPHVPDSIDPLPMRVAAFEREAIMQAVHATRGDIGAAIERLCIPRKTFYYKVQRLGVDLRALRKAASEPSR